VTIAKTVKFIKQTRRIFRAECEGEAVRRMAVRRPRGVSMQQIGRDLDVRAEK
jgi:hypothetical protein